MSLKKIKQEITGMIKKMDSDIIIKSSIIYDMKKLEHALFREKFAASISILDDYTYDFFVVNIDNEEMFNIKTKYKIEKDELLVQIKIDLEYFINL